MQSGVGQTQLYLTGTNMAIILGISLKEQKKFELGWFGIFICLFLNELSNDICAQGEQDILVRAKSLCRVLWLSHNKQQKLRKLIFWLLEEKSKHIE